ncbi:unnamed protein product, partial [Oikopleura dioica]
LCLASSNFDKNCLASSSSHSVVDIAVFKQRTERPPSAYFVVRSQSENNDGANFQVALDEQEMKRRMNKSFCTREHDLYFCKHNK